jgi:hypothetical protein
MKLLLIDSNAKLWIEDIIKTTFANESFHDVINANGFTVVKTATSQNVNVKSAMFPHCSIHK